MKCFQYSLPRLIFPFFIHLRCLFNGLLSSAHGGTSLFSLPAVSAFITIFAFVMIIMLYYKTEASARLVGLC